MNLIFGIIKKLFIIFLPVILALLVIEVILRVTTGEVEEKPVNIVDDGPVYQLDSNLIYSFKPNSTGTLNGEDFIDVKVINKYGFRDIRENIEKDSHVLVTVGDSFVEGIGVERKDSYPAILENELRMDTNNVQVINAGVSGYSPDQEYRLIVKKILPLSPEIILWNITYPYDLYDSAIWYPSLYSISGGQLKARNGWTNWLYFQNFLSVYTPGIVKRTRLYSFVYNHLPGLAILHHRPSGSLDENLDWSMEKLILELRNLNDVIKNKNTKLIVVFIPTKDMFSIDGGFDIMTKSQLDKLLNTFEEKLDENKIEYIDIYNQIMLNRFLDEGVDPSSLFYPNDIHPNRVGNSVLAKAAFFKLTQILKNK